MTSAFIGVDVGTGSARAGVFDAGGRLVASAKRPIAIWREPGDIVEQSSADIWRAATAAVSEAVEASGVPLEAFAGIGFAATCSLVALDAGLAPLSVNRGGRAGARRHGLDGPSRRGGRGAHQRRRPRGPALCRRRHVAGDADAEAGLAEPDEAGDLRPCRAFPRPHRLSHLPRDGLARALALLGRLQVRLSGARAALAEANSSTAWASAPRRADGFARLGAEIVEPGTPLGRGLSAEAAAAMGLLAGHAGRRGPRRRARRRARLARRARGGRARRSAAAPRADPRHLVELPCGLRRAPLHRRRLGPASWRPDARPMADGRRPVGVRRGDRPPHAHASRLRGVRAGATTRWSGRSRRGREARRRRR